MRSVRLYWYAGDRIFGSSLAFNPNNETLYFEDNDRGIAYVETDVRMKARITTVLRPSTGSSTTAGWTCCLVVRSLQRENPRCAIGRPGQERMFFSEAFFTGREIHGMDFIITNPLTVSVDEALAATPNRVSLDPNYPNPFNPATSIRYRLDAASEVRLAVYDVTGRLVRVLEEGMRSAGEHEVRFDGAGLSSGVYLYRLEGGGFSETRKMSLIK